MPRFPTSENNRSRPVALKDVARKVGVSIATVSMVLNESPGADAIPAATKQRIIDAARDLNYRPNILARSLRSQRTYAVGILVPEFSDGYSAMVLNGIEERMRAAGYLCLVASHHRVKDSMERYARALSDRRVEGLIVVDTPYKLKLPLPVISVSGHERVDGVSYVVLNHDIAAELALRHLLVLGHRRIAFLRGQPFTADAEARWNAIRAMARKLSVSIDSQMVAQLDENSPSPEVGYRATCRILSATRNFTALFAFNDISAFGAIRALREKGLQVPRDVSVVGFDDITAAAFHYPALTTVKQPLAKMGIISADLMLKKIAGDPAAASELSIEVAPELVVRESTQTLRSAKSNARSKRAAP